MFRGVLQYIVHIHVATQEVPSTEAFGEEALGRLRDASGHVLVRDDDVGIPP
jgi:hypothetical protein